MYSDAFSSILRGRTFNNTHILMPFNVQYISEICYKKHIMMKDIRYSHKAYNIFPINCNIQLWAIVGKNRA